MSRRLSFAVGSIMMAVGEDGIYLGLRMEGVKKEVLQYLYLQIVESAKG
jgi:hypothetical protein